MTPSWYKAGEYTPMTRRDLTEVPVEIYKDARYRRLMCCPKGHDVFSAGSLQFVTVLEFISGVIVRLFLLIFSGSQIPSA